MRHKNTFLQLQLPGHKLGRGVSGRRRVGIQRCEEIYATVDTATSLWRIYVSSAHMPTLQSAILPASNDRSITTTSTDLHLVPS